jgi:hypothetical protein
LRLFYALIHIIIHDHPHGSVTIHIVTVMASPPSHAHTIPAEIILMTRTTAGGNFIIIFRDQIVHLVVGGGLNLGFVGLLKSGLGFGLIHSRVTCRWWPQF